MVNTKQHAPDERVYGWKPDTLDVRDYQAATAPSSRMPRSVDLSTDKRMREIWDQLQLGSCTAHGTLGAVLFAAPADTPMLSRLQLYWNTRAAEGTTKTDAGGSVRDAIKATLLGIAPETDWPYDIAKFATKPPAKAVADGGAYKTLKYERVSASLEHMLACLAEGYPFVDGMPVFDQMESAAAAKSGQVAMPSAGSQLMGYHCTLTVGYDLDAADGFGGTGVLIKRNSWGPKWGRKGYFTVPLNYRTLISDRWRVTSAS